MTMPEVISPTEEQFSKEIAEHKLTIIRDDGVDRHIRCRRPRTGAYGFDILTWGGHLLINGDMGSWLFARMPDMFEFFRSCGHHGKNYPINPGYWSEKLLASDCRGRHEGGATEFSSEIFERRVKEYMIEHMRANMIGRRGESLREVRREFREDVEYEVIACAEDGEQIAIRAACGFHYRGDYPFEGFWETDCRSYRHHLIWCMHAIVWAIQQYDAL
jgi:hypothetical protein